MEKLHPVCLVKHCFLHTTLHYFNKYFEIFFQVYIVTQKIKNFLEIFYFLKKFHYYQIQKMGLKI